MATVFALNGCGRDSGAKTGKSEALVAAGLELIRQAGQPLTLEELNAWYAEPPAGENAASLYVEAFGALPAGDAKSALYLAQGQQAIALLHKAAAKRQCRYPVDLTQFPQMPLPHLGKIKACCQLLGREAIANASKGRTELAAQAVVDGLRLARSLDQEPLLISQFSRIACDATIVANLETALTQRTFTEEQLRQVQSALREESAAVGQCLARPVAAERCGVIRLFQMTPQDYEKLGLTAGTNAPFGTPAEHERYRQSAAFNDDFALCLDYFSNVLAVATQPFPACLEAVNQCATESNPRMIEARTKGYRICPQLLPNLNHAFERAAECTAQLRVAEAALAIERYRAANGFELPGSLGQLSPKYLAAVPEDPFDGKPLRFRQLSPKGFVVYSIGRDRQDDGGMPKQAAREGSNCDVTFIVKR